MAEELSIGPGTTLKVVEHNEDVLELEATYAPAGEAPPAHLHPVQDERFEVLAGEMNVRLGEDERALGTGEVIDIPRGTTHQMWNGAGEPAVLSWKTTPPGRTLDFFRDVAATMSGQPRIEPAKLLDEYSDTFKLAS
jgi:quercetin dioxygenase-like cupin family protein